MQEPLIPARLARASDGTPYSERYGDVYHSGSGGPEQARHVFIQGNGLPARWQGRDRFVILETGFGLGLNFLATWQAWREDAARCRKLHFASIEKHPFEFQDLKLLLEQHAPLAPLAEQLLAQWPLPLPGMHRLFFENERVVLTLAFADVSDALPQLRLAADALYLDGFAPARNPEMWSPETVRGLARLCAPGATATSWSAAGALREALSVAGFEVEKSAGFARKRDMIVARLRDGFARNAIAPAPQRKAIVIGAGIAGASVCERLCARGWHVTLIERRDEPAQEASGNLAAVFHPVVTRDDNHMSRLTRAGYVAALALWRRLDAAGHVSGRAHCGVLQLARNPDEAQAQVQALARLGYPAGYAEAVTCKRAGALAGVPVSASGIWFAHSGWIRPASLVKALLAACGMRAGVRLGVAAARLERGAEGWRVLDIQGAEIASAPCVVLANAGDALRLVPSPAIRPRQVRGQITHLPASAFTSPSAVILRGGFVLPAIDGVTLAGASFDIEDDDPGLRADSHAGNLHRLAAILPGAAGLGESIDMARLTGRVGFRSVVNDRLPVVGAMPGEDGLYGAFAYASRGIVWSALAAELIASQLEREPLPIEGALVDAIDPARFALRAARRGQAAPRRPWPQTGA